MQRAVMRAGSCPLNSISIAVGSQVPYFSSVGNIQIASALSGWSLAHLDLAVLQSPVMLVRMRPEE